MASDLQINNIPLSSLNFEFRSVLACLDSKKILPSDGPERLIRDWRGLTSLLNISREIELTISEHPDKTGRVLDIWIQRNDGTATLGKLLEYLQRLDRFDLYDDLIDLVKRRNLSASNANQLALVSPPQLNNRLSPPTHDLITFEDVQAGYPQFYDAYVLYAMEDSGFVNDLLQRMRAKGFKLCTIHDLVPGHQTPYGPVAQLIETRCDRIILVYSPEFLNSPDNKFFSDHAQAVGIETKKRNIIPIIYRECQVPANLRYYHKLKYQPHELWYDFWEKLGRSLEAPRQIVRPSHSAMNITELISKSPPALDSNYLLQSSFTKITVDKDDIPPLQALEAASSHDLDNLSQASSSRALRSKSTSMSSKLLRLFKGNKQKTKQKVAVDA